jgi:TRAP transporter TAXI family solute receptor
MSQAIDSEAWDPSMKRATRFWGFLVAAFTMAAILAVLGYLTFTAPLQAKLKIGADRTNIEHDKMAQAIAEIVGHVHPLLKIEVTETSGAGETIRLLANRRIDLAILGADAVVRKSALLVANLYPELFQLLVRRESGIHSPKELAGHRIALPPITSGQFRAFWFLAEHYGLRADRLDAVPMTLEEANIAIRDGTVDAIFRVAGARNSYITSLLERAELRLVPIRQGAAIHLRKSSYWAAILPQGAYRGDVPIPAEDLATVAVNQFLVAGNELQSSIVHAITSVLFENRHDLARRMPLADLISQPSIDKGTPIPVHPGALDYYNRERPSFLEEKAEFLAFLLSFAIVLGSIILAVKRYVSETKKTRIEDYADELLKVEKNAEACRTIPELNKQKARLTQLLARIVADIRAGHVNAEGLQLFSFVWESVNYAVNDHEEQLRLGPGPTAKPRTKKSSPKAGHSRSLS